MVGKLVVGQTGEISACYSDFQVNIVGCTYVLESSFVTAAQTQELRGKPDTAVILFTLRIQ